MVRRLDAFEKRPQSRKHAVVSVASGCRSMHEPLVSANVRTKKKCLRLTFLYAFEEEIDWAGTEGITASHKSRPQLGERIDTVTQGFEKADPQVEHFRRDLNRTMSEVCQVLKLCTFGL
jgi:hypothetical protein